MNTHKQTLKSFSLTSTKMWGGGRGGVISGREGGWVTVQRGGGVAQRDYAVECWTQASMSTLGFVFVLLSLNKKTRKTFYEKTKTAEMGFPIIFLEKHVVPSLNRTNNNKSWKKPLLPSNRRASCSRRGGQVHICKVHVFISTARRPPDRLRGRRRPWELQILHNYNVFYRDSIDPQCVVGFTCKPIMHIALGDCWNYIIYEKYKRTVSIINERAKSSSRTNNTGSTFLFSNVFLWSSKNFILNFRGKLHFLKDNLYLYGYKNWQKWRRLILQGIEKPTPVCSNNECLLWCCLSIWFHLLFILLLLLGLLCIFFFSLFFWILVLLRESVLRCRVVGSRSSVGCTRILITVCNPLAPAASIQSCITWVQPSIKD